jgi:CRP/FNR family cyclic AMP-dependent transcriptional regulator
VSAAPKLPSEKTQQDNTLLETYGSEVLAKLHDVLLFSDIKNERGALEALASIMGSRNIKAGTDILTEGATGTEMFVLVTGRASVYKSTPQGDEYKVAIFEGGQNIAFGESGLIDSDARSATIRADVDCFCIVLERRHFERYSKAFPQWALPIYRRIAQAVMTRMKKTNNDMLLLYNALVAEIRGN